MERPGAENYESVVHSVVYKGPSGLRVTVSYSKADSRVGVQITSNLTSVMCLSAKRKQLELQRV